MTMTTSTDAFAAVTLLSGVLPLEPAPHPRGATAGHAASGLAADTRRGEATGKVQRLLLFRPLPYLGGWWR